MDMGFPCRKNAIFPRAHKIGAAISGPRIADKNFMDTRIFLKKSMWVPFVHSSPENEAHQPFSGGKRDF